MSCSGAQGSQGHTPTRAFTSRNVCLLRQRSPVSGNLPLEQWSEASRTGLRVWILYLSPLVCKVALEMRSLLRFPQVTPLGRPCRTSPGQVAESQHAESGCRPEKQRLSAAWFSGSPAEQYTSGGSSDSSAPSAEEVIKKERGGGSWG